MSSRAIVLAKESDRSFKVLDLAMSSLSEHIARLGASDKEALQIRLASHDLHLLLREKKAGLSHVDAITFIDSHGKLNPARRHRRQAADR
jgi:hypothetical protein